MEAFLAHIRKDPSGQVEAVQTIAEHSRNTSMLCGHFADAFGAAKQGELAGLAHDIGKYSAAFQKRLQGDPAPVDHATAGMAECARQGQLFAAFAVAGHHGGLPDGGSKTDHFDQPTFGGRMNKATHGKLEPYDAWESELSLPSAPLPEGVSSQAEGMFFTRMLYSCLVDADFLDTEEFMAGSAVPRGGGEPIVQLEQKLQVYISGWFPPKKPLDAQRCKVLDRCLEQGDAQTPGLFTLTIPTGGGKTVASLAFALRHAKARGFRRVVYVIPYTSIIEQNAQVFRDILGEKNVLEHHSGVLYDIDQEANPERIRMAKATENWDKPVIVTTAVQFFESLFANRSSKCRKLHNLAQSVIIFDEAQLMPVPYLRPCVFAIAQLVKHYGVSAVLCTATQPSLDGLFREFLPGSAPVELCPPELDHAVFRRVTFRREEGTLSCPALAQRLNERKQALCVVNRRKSTQDVYALLEHEGSFHLSTLMCPAHRKAVLEEIRVRLRDDLPCRVVSTSLIEAGVDVDFPEVFREEAGLDSILQAAGRCNREGKRPADESVVTVFHAEVAVPAMFRRNVDAGRFALDQCEQPDSSEAISCYFGTLLTTTGKSGQDIAGILPLMNDPLTLMPFRTVAERFRLICEDTRTVYIPWADGAELIDRLHSGERTRALFRALGQYSVAVYPEHFAVLNRAGALELLEDGSGILADSTLYSPPDNIKCTETQTESAVHFSFYSDQMRRR